jgi:fatty-acyl-CoA synthase
MTNITTQKVIDTTSPLASLVKGIPLNEGPQFGALTLPGFLREVTTRFADREALVLHTGESVERWTYAMVWDNAMKVARALIACGVGKDSRVGIMMTNRPEWVAGFFGAALAGAVAVPISTFSTAPELEYQLQASAISILLFERSVAKTDFARVLLDLEPQLGTDEPGLLTSRKWPFLRRIVVFGNAPDSAAIESWSEFLAHGQSVPPELVDDVAATTRPSDTGVLFFSSGSTGRPKGVLSRHIAATLASWRYWWAIGGMNGVRCWSPNGFFWSGNFAMFLGGTFAGGGALILQRIFDPVQAVELIQGERATMVHCWPHQWAQLEAAPNWANADLSSLRYIDPSKPAARHPTFRGERWTTPKSYGGSETFTMSTIYPANTAPEIHRDSHGIPLPGNTFKIIDPETGAIVPRGQRGEMALKGPTLMVGYVGVPIEDVFDEDGFYRTGDKGYIDEAGRIYFEGRLSDIIKTGGANVAPAEIDTALSQCPGVKIVKSVGVPHETLGEMVVSCIVPTEGAALSETKVRDYLKPLLASYKVPRRVFFMREDQLAMTGSLKIKLGELRDFAIRQLNAEAADQPRSSGYATSTAP